jgi:hypothetical protein
MYYSDCRIASGNTANGTLKKVYIGPIAPQSFLIDDDSHSDDEIMDLTDGTELRMNMSNSYKATTINPETPPSVSRTLARRSVSYNKPQPDYVRSTDPMPDKWRQELQDIIQISLQEFFQQHHSSSTFTTPQRKRPGVRTTESQMVPEQGVSNTSSPKRRRTTPKVQQDSNDLWVPYTERAAFQNSPRSIKALHTGSFYWK